MICLTGRRDIVFPFCRRDKHAVGRYALAALNISSLHELHVEREGDFVADQNAAGFKRGVPGQAEVFAIDLGGRGQTRCGYCPKDPSPAAVGPSTVNTTLRVMP